MAPLRWSIHQNEETCYFSIFSDKYIQHRIWSPWSWLTTYWTCSAPLLQVRHYASLLLQRGSQLCWLPDKSTLPFQGVHPCLYGWKGKIGRSNPPKRHTGGSLRRMIPPPSPGGGGGQIKTPSRAAARGRAIILTNNGGAGNGTTESSICGLHSFFI